jgi:predicted TIM-barrel fold metal-dependent hydrolase
MTRIIDMHAHYYGGLVERLLDRPARPNVTRDRSGELVLNAMTASTTMTAGYTDPVARLAYMDRAGIDRQLLTFPGALGVDVMPASEVGPIIRAYNEHLAEICRKSRGRFLGLAGLPLAEPGAAAAELTRCRHDLGLLGAILPGNYFLGLSDLRRLEPIFAAANSARALLMIHPGLMQGEAPPAAYADNPIQRASTLNLQASIAHMALTVISAGLAESYPQIVFQLVNLGGTIPFVVERMEAVALSRPPHAPFDRRSLRGLHYDSASLGPAALELAVSVYGADRIMLGTDYPIFLPDSLRGVLEQAAIADSERQLIGAGNAERIVDFLIG